MSPIATVASGPATSLGYDVLIIGAGLAGLSLARHLLLNSAKTVLLIEKRAVIPPVRQKVGEATVQLSAHYLSKVLDLEEHLLREHFIKYNLRFYWKNGTGGDRSYEDYSQSYIRTLSNVLTYQLDRNKLEGEMLRLNLEHANFHFQAPATNVAVRFGEQGPHEVTFEADRTSRTVRATWVVDTSGRGKCLARRLSLGQSNPIRHGASFLWVEGLLNIEKLTDLSPHEIRRRRDRVKVGHMPVWLATNHFCGEGFWLWVIPLHGKTSLGVVYDKRLFPAERVSTPERLIRWVCEEFPLFARDLPGRTILDHGSFRDFSYDCRQTISASRWAVSGEAGRFSDPLYSPGGDLIALHNTLIVDAIMAPDDRSLNNKCVRYEQLMKALYEAYVPSYAVSYDVLGDQQAMTLKYAWELSIYFSFYVFPFINDLFTDRRFVAAYLNRFVRLGPLNRDLQSFLHDYYRWRKATAPRANSPVFRDFSDVVGLKEAQQTLYAMGVGVQEAVGILDRQLANLEAMARFIVAQVVADVLDDAEVAKDSAFVETVDLQKLRFNAEEMRERHARRHRMIASKPWRPRVGSPSASRMPLVATDAGESGLAEEDEARDA